MALTKEKNYFDLFIISVEYTCKTAQRFQEFVKNFDSIKDMDKEVQAIHNIEHEADQHFHAIYQQLNQSFITPIEREDILLLAQSIDDICDSIEAVAFSMYCLNITALKPDVLAFVDLIVRSCSELKVAILEFKKFKKSKILSEKILEVNYVEEEGDRLYHKILRELFKNPTDAIDVLKWREIYEKLETCLDSCENVADILDGILLKNS